MSLLAITYRRASALLRAVVGVVDRSSPTTFAGAATTTTTTTVVTKLRFSSVPTSVADNYNYTTTTTTRMITSGIPKTTTISTRSTTGGILQIQETHPYSKGLLSSYSEAS